MKVLMMIVADYANVEQQTGKLNIIGVFRNIQSRNFPIPHNRMYLVIKIGGDIMDSRNPHELFVTLTDEDGQEIFRIEGPFDMPPSPHGIPPEHNIILELNQLIFHKPGEYVFYFNVNKGEVEESTVIQVVQIEKL